MLLITAPLTSRYNSKHLHKEKERLPKTLGSLSFRQQKIIWLHLKQRRERKTQGCWRISKQIFFCFFLDFWKKMYYLCGQMHCLFA